ncbi:helix-turn-helix domain-containing protein [Paenibacillus sp. NPDC057934]|uniref:helix-turn-helix domain-containing protein n=1 Tax=Paenibacillus sp. NPDC057934 TaxID=3346282 RepID=UPI0036DA8249
MSDLKVKIGERLRSFRTDKGLTQEELADRADVHFTYVGKLERGEVNFTIESIENIMNALELPLENIFRFIQPLSEQENDQTLSSIVNLVHNRNLEDQKKALELLKFVLNWKDE